MKYIGLFILLVSVYVDVFGQDTVTDDRISVGEVIMIESAILGEMREVFIYQPQGFWGMDEQMNNLPVVYVLDGESQFLNTVSTIDFLSSAPNGNDLIPRSIIVGIPNIDRNKDLTPVKGILGNDSTTLTATGGGVNFLNFITEELIPFVDSSYATSSHRTIIGHSLGGLITFEALLRKRNYFDNYVAIDPALGFADQRYMAEIIDSLMQSDLSPEKLFFSCANTRPTFLSEEDLLKDDSDIMKMIDIPNRQFLNTIDPITWQIDLTAKYYPDENHFSVPLRSTYDAMRSFYKYYSFPEISDYYHPTYESRTDLLPRLKEHYNMITAKMGYEVIPMEGYLNSFAFGIGQSGREDLAIELFEYNIELRPQNPILYNNLGYYYMSINNRAKAIEIYKKSLTLKADEWLSDTVVRLQKELDEENK
ncbi:alpha/beta hydrolase-fold protein [Saprospiraceae bacterium]|nr:alpha/beta hydrolase-fold protein [Saprospiraceae bacterium]